MVVLTDQEIDQAEAAILSTLKSAPEPLSPSRLIELLKEQGISEYPARAAMWILLDRQWIDLSSDRLLSISDSISATSGRRIANGR
jgi:DNA-binding transcriptional regulator PaaX